MAEKKGKGGKGGFDPTTLLGILIGTGLIIQGIVGSGDIMNFYDVPSIVIVVGGTFASVIASYPFDMLKELPKHTKILFQAGKYKPDTVINQLEEMAQLARKEGLLALEEKAKEIDDPFFKQGIMMVVDAVEETKTREMLESQMENIAQRHEEAAGLYDKAAAFGPAFGMIGTLVGLINMLKDMDAEGGSDSLGANMSVAMITTFYGCILANVFFMPIAKKLRIRNEEELLYCQIIVDGILSIQSGDNPKFLKEKLISHLTKKDQERLMGGGKKGKKGKE